MAVLFILVQCVSRRTIDCCFLRHEFSHGSRATPIFRPGVRYLPAVTAGTKEESKTRTKERGDKYIEQTENN